MKTRGEDQFALDKIKVLQHLQTIQCDDESSDASKPKIWCEELVDFEDIFERESKDLGLQFTAETGNQFILVARILSNLGLHVLKPLHAATTLFMGVKSRVTYLFCPFS